MCENCFDACALLLFLGGLTQNCKLETVCVQLVLTVELMITSIDVWSSQLSANHLAYLLLSDIHRSLVQLVKELAKDLEILWQVCMNVSHEVAIS